MGPFVDLGGEMDSDRLSIYEGELFTRWPDLRAIKHEADGREALIELVNQELEHLDELLEAHALKADAVAQSTINRLRMDETPTGKSIRDYKLKSTNAFYRGLDACRKNKKGNDPGRVTREDAPTRWMEERRAADPSWQNVAAVSLPESDTSAHAFCANVQINHANEANLDENMIVSESDKPVEVTADFGADQGLDKGEEEKGEIVNSKSEIRGLETCIRGPETGIREPEPKNGMSVSLEGGLGDRVIGGRARRATAKRERKRARREKAKRRQLGAERLSTGGYEAASEAKQLVRGRTGRTPSRRRQGRRCFARSFRDRLERG